MIKHISLLTLILILATSCVSTKVYSDLDEKLAHLKQENRALTDKNTNLSNVKNTLETDLAKLKKEYGEKISELQKKYDKTLAHRNQLQTDYDIAKAEILKLQASYDALEYISGVAIAQNSSQNRELLELLETKEQALLAEQNRLELLKTEMETHSQGVTKLNRAISSKVSQMSTLRDSLSRALTNFEGKGLTIAQRNGSVYVTMENKLIFESENWSLSSKGKQAVMQLAEVLSHHPEIAIVIEGHTDNAPSNGSANISGNWELTTKQAIAIVTLLSTQGHINPENLTATGRGEFAPVASNTSAEGKAKNRRVEVILTPKFDEISKLLNEI